MSTNGCIGICIDGETHLMHVYWDSYPDGLGRRLVRQIQAADIDHWEEAARALNPTEHLCGPGFQLTEDEIHHITSWVAHRVNIQTSIEPEHDDSRGRWVTDCHDDDQGLLESGAELAAVLEPTLRHDPVKFFNAIEGKLNAILELGLYPPLSARFPRTPLCEWVYLIDFDEGVFIVGGPLYDATEWLSNRNIDVWAESDDMIEYQQYAKFPLDNIPEDWEDQVERISDEDQVDYPEDDPQFDPLPAVTTPIVKPEPKIRPKIGPNSPCPCGSGRKHKKCCGRWQPLSPLATLVAAASASILRSSSLDAAASHQRLAEDDWAKRANHCRVLPSRPQTVGA